MKILTVHNKYRERGGEDSVVESEKELLVNKGWKYSQFIRDNDDITTYFRKFSTAINSSYSVGSKSALKNEVIFQQPDIVHVHNFFPVITPSVYDACMSTSTPVVQTLHNYRTICPGALLMRDGKVCEKCVTGSPYHSVLHKCYRSSVLGSLTLARMVSHHRKLKTWGRKVNRFIALTKFAKTKFVDAGFPEDKIDIKPNFIADPLCKEESFSKQKKALFVGRISQEKGVSVMLSAWQAIDYSLNIAGEGAELDKFKATNQTDKVCFLGGQSKEQVHELMSTSQFLIMPSVWYEGFPVVLVEAFAHGLPVICSRLGGMAEIVNDGITGLHFTAGEPDDLARKIHWMIEHPDECRLMGENARREYEEKYTPEKNYQTLKQIYQQAIEDAKNNN